MGADLQEYDVAIAGGGASGTLTALNLLAEARGPLRIALWDRQGRFGQGVAYSTVDPGHRLNVPARAMGAWPDQPSHFLEWLRASGLRADEGDFVARERYGSYLRDLLNTFGRGKASAMLTLHAEGLDEVTTTAEGLVGRLASGAPWRARTLVLALGNQLPADLPVPDQGFYRSDRYHRSPWSPGALTGLPTSAPILLLGAGLTAVDVVVSLHAAGHRGQIHALSRHALWPQPHTPSTPLADGWQPIPGTTLRELLRQVRARIAETRSGESWRAVVDALRPTSQELWKGLSLEEQRRFTRHLRPYWDIHRHRVAPEPEGVIQALLRTGQLVTRAGRLLELKADGDRVVASFRPRGERAERKVNVHRVINCTGPATLGRSIPAILQGLVQRGEAVLDPHGQGVKADPVGALLDIRGRSSERFFTLGPLRRGELWETTAVPEIRVQAHLLARALISKIRML